jgi:hypothetical protein
VPLYQYICDDCGALLDILHAADRPRERCGLDCRRQGEGAFGQGSVTRVPTAPNLATKSKGLDSKDPAALLDAMASIGDVHREALRQKALRKLGGELTEKDLDRLRDKGVGVYRKDGAGRMGLDGRNGSLPKVLKADD